MTKIDRYLHLGEMSAEKEMASLERRCALLGLTIRVFRTVRSDFPDMDSVYSDGSAVTDANIIVIIVGNPIGFISSHHEKLVLIDALCPRHACAFVGVCGGGEREREWEEERERQNAKLFLFLSNALPPFHLFLILRWV